MKPLFPAVPPEDRSSSGRRGSRSEAGALSALDAAAGHALSTSRLKGRQSLTRMTTSWDPEEPWSHPCAYGAAPASSEAFRWEGPPSLRAPGDSLSRRVQSMSRAPSKDGVLLGTKLWRAMSLGFLLPWDRPAPASFQDILYRVDPDTLRPALRPHRGVSCRAGPSLS